MDELMNPKSLKVYLQEHLEKAAAAGIENPVVFELSAQSSEARNLYQAVCGEPMEPPDSGGKVRTVTVTAKYAIELLRRYGVRAGRAVAYWLEEPVEKVDLWVVRLDANVIKTRAFVDRWRIFESCLQYVWLNDTDADCKRSMKGLNRIMVGQYHGAIIENAGNHLLDLLQRHGVVRYSQFYNDLPGTHDELINILNVDGCDFDRENAPIYMDHAVNQLQEAGLVKSTDTDDELVDGTPDYLIELTDEGREFCQSGKSVRYHGESGL